MRKTIYTCDRCLTECLGLTLVDTGNDYSVGKDEFGQKKREMSELCSVCLLELREWMKPNKAKANSTERT